MNERSIFPQRLGDVNADFRFGILGWSRLYIQIASVSNSLIRVSSMAPAHVITNPENSTDSIMQTMPQRHCPGRGDLFFLGPAHLSLGGDALSA